ncbi:helix-turn-helix domain-containing protein [Cellulomonas sp. Root137]|uniref:helix-turn-helix domain-containing protein n=1 Tax=Cellulomonas sp. Root137 TaxID=1736459 RepID=UPI0006FE259E|nr:helix-turn-helix transcriptional regulator [Cellulomonas sp. Root137]KQY46385.1 XRE family transcriptional regulator [Cellulomonas sp. Root137]
MDNRDEVKDFLRTRRARLTPTDVGLTAFASTRRVPGLKRSEVADLAGVSVEYYAQLERGNLAGVSDSVLDALARALQLDEAERTYLADLARAAAPATRSRRRSTAEQVRPGVQRLLDLIGETVPAIVNNARLDAIGANVLGRALFAPVYTTPHPADTPANHARFTFLDDRARDFWVDWDRAADDAVSQLRTEAGRDPYDRALSDLVGELSTQSPEFRTRWAAHDVRLHRTGRKHVRHPVVGELHLDFEVLELPVDPGLTLITFTAPAGSPDEDGLRMLASWGATHPATEIGLSGPPR